MTKKKLMKDIETRCFGKCERCSICISEIKESKESEIYDKDGSTQCRLYVDEPTEPDDY